MAAKRKKKAKKTKAQLKAQNQIVAVLMFTLGLLFIFMAFIKGSEGWLFAHNLLLGLFGWSAFFIGALLVYISVMASFEKFSYSISARSFLTGVLICLISAAFQIFLAGKPQTQTLLGNIRQLYADGQALHGGGVISALFGYPLMLLGAPGDRIAVSLLLFLVIMLITRSTIAGILRCAKRPVEKLQDGYHELVNSMPSAQPVRESSRKMQIDIPLDGEPEISRSSKKPKENLAEKADVSSSRKKLLSTVTDMSSDPAVKAAEKPTAAPAPDSAAITEKPGDDDDKTVIDDIINRVAAVQAKKSGNAEETIEPEKSVENAESTESTGSAAEEISESAPAPQPPEYIPPSITLLREPPENSSDGSTAEELRQNAQLLVDTLQSFGVQTRIIDISRGPAVTRYELQPSAGVKISKITNLADDIALNLATAGVRIEAPIPNKAAVGIEVPNRKVSAVTLREIISSKEFSDAKSKVTMALGRDISGNVVTANIAKMPHLLIAGATGSGKSVCINSIIMSILFKARPDEVKLLLIDPKVVELGVYNGLPHLVVPVVTDPKKAAGSLGWAVTEMLNRYKLFAAQGARDIESYNKIVESLSENLPDQGEGSDVPKLSKLPHYVIVVDELADLMMAAPSDVEDHICRLAQMARAAGMHLIIATQRPSVDVITGVIKANIPSRIAFAVSSQIDSRTILDAAGAEKLLGMGDMLFSPVGSSKPTRVQGCFVSDEEIERVVSFIKSAGVTDYDEQVLEEIDRHVPAGKGNGGSNGTDSSGDADDEMLPAAIECVVEAGLASTSLLQRKLKLGYARAARIVDAMEAKGIVGSFEGSKPRSVLISKERWLEMKLNSADNNQE